MHTLSDPPLYTLYSLFSFFFRPTAWVAHVLMLFSPLRSRNLTAWAEAGVLMLNTCLTVRARTAGSHQGKGWEQFTDRVIEVVDRYGGANLGAKSGLGQGVVFLAWGSWAAKRVAKLNKVSHPAPS
jgi:uracil-DNA glycosylase